LSASSLESILDDQSVWTRKLVEALIASICFEDANEDGYYRHYLLLSAPGERRATANDLRRDAGGCCSGGPPPLYLRCGGRLLLSGRRSSSGTFSSLVPRWSHSGGEARLSFCVQVRDFRPLSYADRVDAAC